MNQFLVPMHTHKCSRKFDWMLFGHVCLCLYCGQFNMSIAEVVNFHHPSLWSLPPFFSWCSLFTFRFATKEMPFQKRPCRAMSSEKCSLRFERIQISSTNSHSEIAIHLANPSRESNDIDTLTFSSSSIEFKAESLNPNVGIQRTGHPKTPPTIETTTKNHCYAATTACVCVMRNVCT